MYTHLMIVIGGHFTNNNAFLCENSIQFNLFTGRILGGILGLKNGSLPPKREVVILGIPPKNG